MRTECDIDGDDRIYGLHVDIGADEFACEELTHTLDWTFDGIIDPAELAIFAVAWIEDLWANDPDARKAIDKKAWKNFMDQIYTWVANIEEEL